MAQRCIGLLNIIAVVRALRCARDDPFAGDGFVSIARQSGDDLELALQDLHVESRPAVVEFSIDLELQAKVAIRDVPPRTDSPCAAVAEVANPPALRHHRCATDKPPRTGYVRARFQGCRQVLAPVGTQHCVARPRKTSIGNRKLCIRVAVAPTALRAITVDDVKVSQLVVERERIATVFSDDPVCRRVDDLCLRGLGQS